MIRKQIHEKGILAKLLEQGIRILLVKECKEISNVKIDIISSSTEIIKGEIQKITIIADDINYKDLIFDSFNLEANHIKINIRSTNKELSFIDIPVIKFKISLSQNSLRTVLFSDKWNWIRNMISEEILNQKTLEDIEISNGKVLMKSSDKNITTCKVEQINIKSEEGKIYLENKSNNKAIQIPIEEKIYIENVTIENSLINFIANSPISF